MDLKCEYVEGWTLSGPLTTTAGLWGVWYWSVLIFTSGVVGAMEWTSILHWDGPQQEPTEKGTASDVIGRSTRMLPLSHGSGRRTVPVRRKHRNDLGMEVYRVSAVNKHRGV